MSALARIGAVSLVNDEWIAHLRTALARAESGESRAGIVIEETPDSLLFEKAGMDRIRAVGALTVAASRMAVRMEPL